jgi:transposase
MRYELTDYEWAAIKPFLPNKPRGVPRVNDRRVINGIFWVLRSGAPWRDLPDNFGPYTTCYNRFVRWRRAGVWGAIMNALAATHDAAVQMIDTSIIRVHQHAACITAAGVAKVYSEKISGARSDRPELAKLLKRLQAGDVLVVTRLDRLARSTRDLLNILDTVGKAGAKFRSLGDTWADTTTPNGRLLLTVLGGLAEFERDSLTMVG